MAFQFQCPQGHLLSGDESQAGQQCHCPTCGMLFIIPQPIAAPSGGAGDASPGDRFAGLNLVANTGSEVPAFVPGESTAATATAASQTPSEPELLHIPCPNGHELETPADMLDQDVLCPQCNAQFRLKRKNSVEFLKKKELEERIRLEKVGSLWLTWAIVAVVVVVVGLLGLVVASNLNQEPAPTKSTGKSPRDKAKPAATATP
jgi:rubredoxin